MLALSRPVPTGEIKAQAPALKRSRHIARPAGGQLAQFHHAMADVPILGQVGGGTRLPVETHFLVHRVAMGKLWIQLLAKFTGVAGSYLEPLFANRFNVFHFSWAPYGVGQI